MGLYVSVKSSIIKYVETYRKATFTTASYVDWDAHADISTLPTGDLCGPAGVALTRQDAQLSVGFAFGLATVDDDNLFRLTAMVDGLFSALQPGSKIPLYNEAGDDTGHWIIIKTPVTIGGVSKAQVRAIQFITLLGLVDFGGLSLS